MARVKLDDVIVYTSESSPAKGKEFRGRITRMALHPMDRSLPFGENPLKEHKWPFRVVYSSGIVWRTSCRTAELNLDECTCYECGGIDSPEPNGYGHEFKHAGEALAWLLDGLEQNDEGSLVVVYDEGGWHLIPDVNGGPGVVTLPCADCGEPRSLLPSRHYVTNEGYTGFLLCDCGSQRLGLLKGWTHGPWGTRPGHT